VKVWDTPFGPSVRYTIRFRVVGERVDTLGSARSVDRSVEYRVVTPHGEHAAVALAAVILNEREPDAIYREVELVSVETDFTRDVGDIRDRDSMGR
jgi:hypothetical protein